MDAAQFLNRAGPLLLADEARHNLILGIAGTVRDDPAGYPDAAFWVVDGAAALRTRPYNLVLAQPRDEDALHALVAAIEDDVPGVSAAVPEAYDFALAWGRPHRVVQEHNVFALERVEESRPTDGSYRKAGPEDMDVLLAWWQAFVREALPHEEVGPRDRDQITRKLASGSGGFGLWERDGEVVCMCGYGSPTPNGIRIGPVYTPPELRGHGYASALTAETSQRLLDAGRSFCFLYTDAANPTSNAIYERIGYRKVCEPAALAFA
jgi:predicted GNAT family acetyltransferase